jgi:hypothetical protein
MESAALRWQLRLGWQQATLCVLQADGVWTMLAFATNGCNMCMQHP